MDGGDKLHEGNTVEVSAPPPIKLTFQNGKIVATNGKFMMKMSRLEANIGNGRLVILDGTDVTITTTPPENFTNQEQTLRASGPLQSK